MSEDEMEGQQEVSQAEDVLEIHIVSGGVGASAELLAHTVLAQFPDMQPSLHIHPHIHDEHEVHDIVSAAADADALILHTLVNPSIRQAMIQTAEQYGVDAIDVFGPFIDYLSDRLETRPIGQAGRYRRLYNQYFKRVGAIEFTIAHDDGQRSAELVNADIVLMGVSRVGKTPLSMYLAMQGWKVANVPFVPDITLPQDFWQVDRRRVVGLLIEPPQLAIHRKWREKRLGITNTRYIERQQIASELREANRFYAAHDIPVVDVTNKPIETSGTEIIAIVTRRVNSLPARTMDEARS